MTVHGEGRWRKSRYSYPASNCLELCGAAGLICVRDSKKPDAELSFATDKFRLLTKQLKRDPGWLSVT